MQEVIADGAYDTKQCREAIATRGARALIRSRQSSVTSCQPYPGSEERDEAIQVIKGLGNDSQALQLWKTLTR